MPKQEFMCRECGTPLLDYPSHPRKFCSRGCFHESRRHGRVLVKPKTGRYEPCEACGIPVWRTPSDLLRNNRKFCSRPCLNEHQRLARTERFCERCGMSMGIRLQSDLGRFCSLRCSIHKRTKWALDRTHNGVPARTNSTGYVLVYEPTHPKAQGAGWVYEHRLVAERMVGRILLPEEIVHHINRVKDDNREENLAIVDSKTHARFTANERMSDRALLYEYMRRFGPIDV